MRPRHPGAPATFIRFALPDHREIAVDGKRTVQLLGDFGIDIRFDPVPIEEHDDQYQNCQQGK
ncbi:hypothetical protein D3C78_1770170 [compost metagenome]